MLKTEKKLDTLYIRVVFLSDVKNRLENTKDVSFFSRPKSVRFFKPFFFLKKPQNSAMRLIINLLEQKKKKKKKGTRAKEKGTSA